MAATIFVTGPLSLYLLRFLLGVAEAGFFPGVAFYLGTWFPSAYRTRMIAWFMVAVPISSVVAGPVSGELLRMDQLQLDQRDLKRQETSLLFGNDSGEP